MQQPVIGIMGAMPEEINGIISLLENTQTTTLGQRDYTSGLLHGIPTVVVFSRWGKVAAAATVSTLIHEFKITQLYFTGVAGAIHPDLKIGDIVIGKRLMQHDMDARPLMQQYEIPLLSKTFFESDLDQLDTIKKTIEELAVSGKLTAGISPKDLAEFSITTPKIGTGDIASGDQFFARHDQKENLSNALPSILCVEMEGAAVAQVCYEYDIPFAVIRTISDTADDNSPIDFLKFVRSVASHYSATIIAAIYQGAQKPY